MGGCASRPKDLNCTPATLPGENSIAEPVIKDVEVETTAEEKKKGDESQTEEPLVDLSEPTEDLKAEKEESKNAIDDLVTEISAPSDEKQTEEKAEAVNETTEKIKDEEPAPKVVEEKKDETPKSDAAEDEKLLNSETAEKKDDAPLVSA
ncbi:hypothetical protein BVC80_237g61 [Macleaya cordata]|uniref:Uncharacterized protein n=1 Tax=Macleaya cordata TaxID=56857 RepID=A0A200RB63_MACCD|nr:hypothetical protein BVC80_237g61 [Macleaya cordata]